MNFFICAVITALCGPSQSTAAGRTWSMLLWYTWYRFVSSHNHNFQTTCSVRTACTSDFHSAFSARPYCARRRQRFDMGGPDRRARLARSRTPSPETPVTPPLT
ncbi:hypothetical protein PR001_g26146 [Phytophthora rubi]|uniref:Secreted protein n=1 Tax=Phytophthora rubi TaxID=129364 RepID=A0A6A3HTE9_9STRA|nr:hypothetical protein PR001_g26146 [Phytophthora rubi]